MLARVAIMSSKALAAPGFSQARMLHSSAMHASTRSPVGMGHVATRPPLIPRRMASMPVLRASSAAYASEDESSSQIWKDVRSMQLQSGRKMNLGKPTASSTAPELARGVDRLSNISSSEEFELIQDAVRGVVQASDKTGVQNVSMKSLGAIVTHVVKACRSRIIEVMAMMYPDLVLKTVRLRVQLTSSTGKYHADTADYVKRVCMPVMVSWEDVVSYFKFRESGAPERESRFGIRSGEAFIMDRGVGSKGSAFQHTTSGRPGLILIFDFGYRT